MPHAENVMGDKPMTNGEKPQFKTLSHITGYPVVSDLISTYTSNPYGQKSVSFANDIYNQTVKPVLPYFQTPYSYVAPYVSKADELGDASLSKVDTHFPIVKEDTEKVKSTIFDYAFYPLRFANDTKTYVFKTYDDEYQKTGGQGIITTAKAFVSTELKITSDAFHLVGEWLGPKKEQAKNYYSQAQDKAGELRSEAEKKYGELRGQTEKTADEAKKQASETKKQASETKKQANEKVNG